MVAYDAKHPRQVRLPVTPTPEPPEPRFDGQTYVAGLDGARLSSQLARVSGLMADRCWRTLAEIARAVGSSEASVSARLRDLRKLRFGRFQVQRRRVVVALALQESAGRGLFEYRVLLNPEPAQAHLPVVSPASDDTDSDDGRDYALEMGDYPGAPCSDDEAE